MPCGGLWHLPWRCSGAADRVRQWISLEATSKGRHSWGAHWQWHLTPRLPLKSKPSKPSSQISASQPRFWSSQFHSRHHHCFLIANLLHYVAHLHFLSPRNSRLCQALRPTGFGCVVARSNHPLVALAHEGGQLTVHLSTHTSSHIPRTSSQMSETASRASASRGRGSGRGGRGGFAGRGGRRTNGDKADHTTGADASNSAFDDEGDIGELRKLYGHKTAVIREMFEDWSEVDVLFALQETNGDENEAVTRIAEGMQSSRVTMVAHNITAVHPVLDVLRCQQ
jgi:hypothetical protein